MNSREVGDEAKKVGRREMRTPLSLAPTVVKTMEYLRFARDLDSPGGTFHTSNLGSFAFQLSKLIIGLSTLNQPPK